MKSKVLLAEKNSRDRIEAVFSNLALSFNAVYDFSEKEKIPFKHSSAIVFAELPSGYSESLPLLRSLYEKAGIHLVLLVKSQDEENNSGFENNVFSYLTFPPSKRELEMILYYYENISSIDNLISGHNNFFEGTLSTVQEGICLLDKEFKILRTNNILKNWYSENLPLEGKRCYEAFHGKKNPCDDCPTIKAVSSRNLESSIISGPSDSGKNVWFEIFANPVLDDYGKVTAVVEFVRDITENKELTDKLSRSEERWINALEGSGYGVWDWDLNTNKVFFSRQWKAMLGYTDNEIEHDLGEWERRVHPDDIISAYDNIQKHLSGITSEYCNEHRMKARDGSYKWILDRGKVTEFDRDGNPSRFIGTHADITEQKMAGQLLRESEERYRKVFDSIPMISIQGYNTRREVIFWNKASEDLYGYTSEEALGRKLEDLIIPEDLKEKVLYDTRNYIDLNRHIPAEEITLQRKDGSRVPVFSSHVKYENYAGEAELYCVDLDLSQLKRHQLIQKVINEIATATSSIDDLNDFLRSLRISLSKIVNTHNFFIALYNEEDNSFSLPVFVDDKDRFNTFPAGRTLTEYMLKINQPVLMDEEEINILEEQDVIDRVGSLCKQWLGVPLRKDGKVLGAIVLQSYTDEAIYDDTDIRTLQIVAEQISIAIDRKARQEELRESERTLKTLISNLPGIAYRCRFDKFYTMEFLSDGFTILTGYPVDYCINNNKMSYSDLIHPEDRDDVWNQVNLSVLGNEPYNLVFRIIASGGLVKWVWEKGRAVKDVDGNIIALEGFIIDITDRIEMENQIISAKEKAEESDRLKSAFLSNLSHEIRSPMNSIIGFSQLLKYEKDPDAVNKYVDFISQSSRQLLHVVSNIVDQAKIDSDQMPVRKFDFSPGHLLDDIYKYGLEQLVLYNGKQETVQICSDNRVTDNIVFSDEALVGMALKHLIHNAVKFTDYGRIEIGSFLTDNKMVSFFVKDTGIGISPEYHGIIFERFRQVDERISRDFDGAGLGLSIAKGIALLLKGDLRVRSSEGSGSDFYFTIPLK